MKSLVLLLALLIALPIYAAEHYIWIDEKGVTNITSRPPQHPVKVIGKEAYQKDSPEEIRRYEEEQRLKRIQAENEQRVRSYYDRLDEGRERLSKGFEDAIYNDRLEQARGELKRAEERQEELADERRNARRGRVSEHYDDEKKKVDKIVEQKRREVMDLENAR